MYIGLKTYDYKLMDSIEFEKMFWDLDSNYLDEAFAFIDKNFRHSIVFEFRIKTLLSLILENVHDHGSSACVLKYGIFKDFKIIEVYEPKGGFDLADLPNGTGGCGFKEIKSNKCIISHNKEGTKTFILIES